MAVKIKLKRMGKIRTPHYRIIIADSRTRRDGRAIEEIGLYNPKVEPSLIKVDSERAQYWLGVGAQPTDPVLAILKITGDWQKYKGLPGAEGTLRVAEPKAEKRAAFDAALAEVHGEAKEPKEKAPAAKKKSAKKSTAKKSASADNKAETTAEGTDESVKSEKKSDAPKAKKAASKPKKASAAKDESAPKAEAAAEASGDEA